MADALAGIRVLDFTQAWAGPTCARFLGDFGADVIKVESETALDISRVVGPFPNGEFDVDCSGNHLEWSRNKRSIVLNMKDERERDLALGLARECDVVVENFSPRVMPSFGMDYESIKAINPDVIMCSISGFGATGPFRLYPAFGQQVEAIAGLMSITGYEPDGVPLKAGVSYPDPISGIAGAGAIGAALIHRERTGEGQWIDLAMVEIANSLLSEAFMRHSLTGEVPQATGNSSPWYEPHGIFPCAGDDRWIAIECHDDAERAALEALTGGEELERWTAGQDAHELAARLQAAGVRAAPVTTIADLMADEHLRARGFWFDSWHPKAGPVVLSGPMARLERTPARDRLPAPLLDEHREAILGVAKAAANA